MFYNIKTLIFSAFQVAKPLVSSPDSLGFTGRNPWFYKKEESFYKTKSIVIKT